MRIPRGRALTYAIIAAALGFGAWAMGVSTLFGQQLEAMVLQAATFSADPPAPLGLVTTPRVAIATVIIAALAWIVHGFSRALIVTLSVGVSLVASQLLKHDVLVRPELFEFDADNTFPSGHMTIFVALSGALIWAVPRGLKACAVLMSGIVSAIVAWQLIEYSWHRPSDVVGALALTLLVFALFALFAVFFPLPSKRQTPERIVRMNIPNRILSFTIWCISVVILVGGLGLTALGAFTGSPQLMINGSQLALVGTTGLTARAFQALAP